MSGTQTNAATQDSFSKIQLNPSPRSGHKQLTFPRSRICRMFKYFILLVPSRSRRGHLSPVDIECCNYFSDVHRRRRSGPISSVIPTGSSPVTRDVLFPHAESKIMKVKVLNCRYEQITCHIFQ
jgi:hypothetical protein